MISAHRFRIPAPLHILVTGCAGFIGSKVSEKLLERGDFVLGVDNMNDYYDPRLKEWRLGNLLKSPSFNFEEKDIADRNAMERLFRENTFHAVINLAARAGVRASIENPWIYYDANVEGTLNLLECCRRHNVKKFLLGSTSSVYGSSDIPFNEDNLTDGPLSPYAASKKAAEVLCHSFHYLYNLDITALRYFTVYGPAGRPDMAYFKFIEQISEDRPIEVYGDGKQKRDFTFIDDIAEATIRALPLSGYQVLNLGYGNPVELAYMIKVIEDLLGKKARVKFIPRHPADVIATWADNTKARSLLGWCPRVNIEDGLKLTVTWFLDHRKQLKDVPIHASVLV